MEAFLDPVVKAGGSVLLVPAIPEAVDANAIARTCDGLLLTGSWTNMAPASYGGSSCTEGTNPDRDSVSLTLAERMIARGHPVLGICLGMQELAVLYGSTLRCLQKNPTHMAQCGPSGAGVFEHKHEVDLLSSRMTSMAGTSRVAVVSAHYQAIDRISNSLTVEAEADDGTIEAIRADEEGRVCGVQWHPERLVSRLDHALFRNLIDLA